MPNKIPYGPYRFSIGKRPLNDQSKPAQGLSYKDAGVDIDAGNELVELIKPAVRKTLRPEVLTGLDTGSKGARAVVLGTWKDW